MQFKGEEPWKACVKHPYYGSKVYELYGKDEKVALEVMKQ